MGALEGAVSVGVGGGSGAPVGVGGGVSAAVVTAGLGAGVGVTEAGWLAVASGPTVALTVGATLGDWVGATAMQPRINVISAPPVPAAESPGRIEPRRFEIDGTQRDLDLRVESPYNSSCWMLTTQGDLVRALEVGPCRLVNARSDH